MFYLEKDLTIEDRRKEEFNPVTNVALATGGVGAGGIGGKQIQKSLPELSGLETGGHVTDKKNADKILGEGLRADLANSTNNSQIAGINAIKGSGGHTYGYRSKATRDAITNAIADRGDAKNGVADLKYRIPYEDIRTGKVNIVDNPELRGLSKQEYMDYLALKKEKAFDYTLPFTQRDSFVTALDTSDATDHELVKKEMAELSKKYPNASDELLNLEKKQIDAAYRLLGKDHTHTFKGDLPAEYFKDSDKYRGYGVRDWKQYAKNNKGRLAKGVGRLTGGAALVGGGGYGLLRSIQNARAEEKRLKEEEGY